jgi:hypothetical protein
LLPQPVIKAARLARISCRRTHKRYVGGASASQLSIGLLASLLPPPLLAQYATPVDGPQPSGAPTDARYVTTRISFLLTNSSIP